MQIKNNVPFVPTKWARSIAAFAVLSIVASCAILPSAGPTKRQIFSGSVQKGGNAFVVEVDDRIARAAAVAPAFGFSSTFKNASPLTTDTIRAGDTLGLRVWENVDDGLLGGGGEAGGPTALTEIQVDSSGHIFVPYAGRIKAAGNTPERLRQIITDKLAEQTPDPQVEVVRSAGDGATVSIVGNVGTQGVFPIERSTRTLTSMLAAAGGVAQTPEVVRVTVTRGGQQGTVWLQDLFENPNLDIALRGGDKILVEQDDRTFHVLGAAGGQGRVRFEKPKLSVLEAIAQVGGLNPVAADPKGVFVLRDESSSVANAVLGRKELQGSQRMIYVLNLTEPNGLFVARDFVIRDGDTLYITEAPYSQWTKTISLLTGGLTPLANVATLTQ